ncbi:MAG: carboxynorspermidine decarboxylase [Spirochaetales bacterium]|nr:carboxynorspermidine decarboxylase [Spirochaetales bacterium]
MSIHRELGLAPDRPYFEQFSPAALPSPCFVVDKAALQYNLDILKNLADRSGAKILAALKAFSFYHLFDQVADSLSGGCASGVYEARLAREHINKEVHVFSPAYTDRELEELLTLADHLVFNNLHQWLRFQDRCLAARKTRPQLAFGIRVNPEHSEGTTEIYDPCAPYSRLGITRSQWDLEFARALGLGKSPEEILWGLSGFHFHTLCEQGAEPLERTLGVFLQKWGDLLVLPTMTWLNLGGGHHITKPDYNRELLVSLVRHISAGFAVQVYLEPGEAVAIHTGILAAQVVDIHNNNLALAILNTSATCHMPDTLEIPYTPAVWGARSRRLPETLPTNPPSVFPEGEFLYRLGGQTCLAGDVIGDYWFNRPLEVGDWIVFDDMAHYTMVKTTTFNGIPLPTLATFDSRTGKTEVIKTFGYQDFKSRI